MFDRSMVNKLEVFFATKMGLVAAAQNAEIAADKAQKLEALGVFDVMTPILGETYVELNECQMKVWDEKAQEDVVHVVVTAR